MNDLDIRFEETDKGGRYFAVMPNGEQSRLTFVTSGGNHIVADHTFVPPAYRNRGVGEAIVERLVADARTRKQKITPACWFVAEEFARRSPEWDDLLAR